MNAATREVPEFTLIGNGMVTTRLIEEIRNLWGMTPTIRVFGAESHPGYNRILLSPLLARELPLSQVITHRFEWYAQQQVELYSGCEIVAIDRAQRTLTDHQGRTYPYRTLVLATGSRPIWLNVPGHTLSGITAFRDLNDSFYLEDRYAQGARHAVVIGGGLLGLETACGLVKQGLKTTVIHLGQRLLDRQLDAPAATLLEQALVERGVQFCLAAQTERFVGDDHVTAVQLSDGRQLPADLVVLTLGIRPNIALAQQAHLPCHRGIVVDDQLRTEDPAIFALGECAEHRGVTYGLVEPLWEQARVAALTLKGGNQAYVGSLPSAKLKVSGINLFSVGVIQATEHDQELVLRDSAWGVYRKLVVRDDRLVGAVLYGDVSDGLWYAQLIQHQTSITALRERLLFGFAACSGRAA